MTPISGVMCLRHHAGIIKRDQDRQGKISAKQPDPKQWIEVLGLPIRRFWVASSTKSRNFEITQVWRTYMQQIMIYYKSNTRLHAEQTKQLWFMLKNHKATCRYQEYKGLVPIVRVQCKKQTHPRVCQDRLDPRMPHKHKIYMKKQDVTLPSSTKIRLPTINTKKIMTRPARSS